MRKHLLGRHSRALLLLTFALPACSGRDPEATGVRNPNAGSPRAPARPAPSSTPGQPPPTDPPKPGPVLEGGDIVVRVVGPAGAGGELLARENGAEGRLAVKLARQPTAPVTIGLSASLAPGASASGQGTLSVTELTFTPESYATEQVVSVKATDDSIPDGDQGFEITAKIAKSEDWSFAKAPAVVVKARALDNDAPLFRLESAIPLTVREGTPGGPLAFRVLQAPTKPTQIRVSTSAPGQVRVTPEAFTMAPGATTFTVNVQAVDDAVIEDRQVVTLSFDTSVSEDPVFAAAKPFAVPVDVDDDDRAGARVTLTSTELVEGGSTTARVRLTSRPSAPVRVALRAPEGLTVRPASVTIAPEDYETGALFTVTAAQDDVARGRQTLRATVEGTSDDRAYANDALGSFEVGVSDDDVPAILAEAVGDTRVYERSDLAPGRVRVRLATQPQADVQVQVYADAYVGSVESSWLRFTPQSWSTPQEVLVRAYDNEVVDGERPFHVYAQASYSSDPNYAYKSAPSLAYTSIDDDVTELVVQGSRLVVTEWGVEDSFLLTVTKCVASPVAVPVEVSDPSRLVVAQARVEIPAGTCRYSGGATVTLRAKGSGPDTTVAVKFGKSESSLPGAHGLTAPDEPVLVLSAASSFSQQQTLLAEATIHDVTESGRYALVSSTRCDPNGSTSTTCRVDVQTGERAVVPAGSMANGTRQWSGRLSEDGASVAVGTTRDQMVPFDTNGRSDVFFHDVVAGRTRALNVGAEGWLGNAEASLVGIRAGSMVFFRSAATDLLPNVREPALYRFDPTTAALSVVNVDPSGAVLPLLNMAAVQVSRDANVVVFPTDAPAWAGLVARSLSSGQTRRVLEGEEVTGVAQVQLTRDGATMLFTRNEVDGPPNAWMRPLDATRSTLANREPDGARFAFFGIPALSPSGRYAAFLHDTLSQDRMLVRVVDTSTFASRYAVVPMARIAGVTDDGRTLLVVTRDASPRLLRLTVR